MSVLADIYRDRTQVDFVARRRVFLVASLVAVVVCAAGLVFRQLNLNIDFEGGSQWEAEVSGRDIDVGDVRGIAEAAGVLKPRVTTLGGDTVRVQAEETDPDAETAMTDALAAYAGVDRQEVSFSSVGPTWGDEISTKMLQATALFFAAVAVYLSLRLELKMAVAALVALAHDLVITLGVYALLQIEVSPATVVAILTILGYSLYDTVVVFDKVKENLATHGREKRHTYSALANLSLNQTITRSLNTTITSVLPVLSILVVGSLILGATGLEDFGVALFIGLIVGAYSSIFVASQVLVWWREREPAWVDVRERVVARNPGVAVDMLWPELTPSTTRTVAARPRRGSSGRPLPLADRPPVAPATPERPALAARVDDDPLPAELDVDDGDSTSAPVVSLGKPGVTDDAPGAGSPHATGDERRAGPARPPRPPAVV